MGLQPLEDFIVSLRKAPSRAGVFNPWYQVDIENELGQRGPGIRRRQLSQYLTERTGKAKYLLVGEAVGYQGGHFSGIPMTSERILLGGQREKGIFPEHVFRGLGPSRTSRPERRPGGFSEPTATIVWGLIVSMGLDPYEFILWNSFPWHPFNPERGMLSNRTPDEGEFLSGLKVLEKMLSLARPGRVLALGNKADLQLKRIGVSAVKLRHPANAGAAEFRRQFQELMKKYS